MDNKKISQTDLFCLHAELLAGAVGHEVAEQCNINGTRPSVQCAHHTEHWRVSVCPFLFK